MCGSRILFASVAGMLLLTAAGSLAGEAHDVRGWNPQTDANDVIDAKCKNCHSRQRVDAAFANKVDIDAVLRQMEKKGLKLNEKEREVLGIFGQQPFRKK